MRKEANGPKLLAGVEYVIDLVNDVKEGLWKAKSLALDAMWMGEGEGGRFCNPAIVWKGGW